MELRGPNNENKVNLLNFHEKSEEVDVTVLNKYKRSDQTYVFIYIS